MGQAMCGNHSQRRVARQRAHHVIPGVLEFLRHHIQHGAVIIDHEDSLWCARTLHRSLHELRPSCGPWGLPAL
jgi:hypothetical protein